MAPIHVRIIYLYCKWTKSLVEKGSWRLCSQLTWTSEWDSQSSLDAVDQHNVPRSSWDHCRKNTCHIILAFRLKKLTKTPNSTNNISIIFSQECLAHLWSECWGQSSWCPWYFCPVPGRHSALLPLSSCCCYRSTHPHSRNTPPPQPPRPPCCACHWSPESPALGQTSRDIQHIFFYFSRLISCHLSTVYFLRRLEKPK